MTTLSLLDPVRAYEDYATLDHLSGGRLELIIGKGNGAAQRELFHVTAEDQWDRNAESYELFRRLWRERQGHRPARFRPAAARRRGLAAAAAAADPDLARQRHQPGVGRPGRPLRRPAVLRQRHQPDRAVRRAGRATTGNAGRTTATTRPTAARRRRARAGYYAARTLAGGASTTYRPVFDGAPGASSSGSGVDAGLPDAGGLRRAQLGADRQPAADHRQGAPLPRAARPHRAAPARRRRRAHRRRSTATSLELFQAEIAPVLRREIPDPPWPWRRVPADRRARRRRRLRRTAMPTRRSPSSTSSRSAPASTAAEALRNSIDLARQAERARLRAATGSPSTTSTPASPAPRRRCVLALIAAATDHDPARLRRGADRPPHRAVHGGGVRPASTRCTPAGSTSASAGPAAAARPGRDAGARPAPRPRRSTAAAAERPADPAAVLLRAAARLAALRAAARAAAAARRRSRRTTPSRSTTSWPCCAARYRDRRRRRGARRARRGRGRRRCGSSAAAAARAPRSPARTGLRVRRQLPRQPGHRAGGGRRLPGRVPAVGRRSTAPYVSVSADVVVGRRRGDRAGAGGRLRPVGAQHPHRRGRDPVPDPGARPARTPGPTPTGRWSPTGSTPSSSAPRRRSPTSSSMLRDATGADELIVTTITHDHADRVRSYELLAQEWQRR